ncbi:MAG: hypothetical protein RIF33_02560 [Cyclobacteriaceae bacterium]
MRLIATILLVLSIASHHTSAQKTDSVLFTEEEEALLAELEAMDSLSLFSLIDNLLTYEPIKSTVNVRLGYNGQVTTAGRDLGVNQYGLSPGVSYYHKSGAYADLSSYWNSEFDPQYHLTVVTLGYLELINTEWSYNLSYDHSFFNGVESSITNSLSGGLSWTKKYLNANVNYSYWFGTETAHRLVPSLSGYFTFKPKNSFISRIVMMPTASILLGNQSILNIRFNDNETVRRTVALTNLDDNRLRQLVNRGILTRQEALAVFVLKNPENFDLSQEQYDRIYDFLYTEETTEAFGIMNYYLTVPVSIYINQFSVMLSYTYNIPVELPGESINLENTSYLSVGINYTFGK